jgi:hypothetical protein
MTAPTITDPDDPVRAFRSALPSHIASRLHPTDRAVACIHRAVGRGWSIDALVAECTRSLGGVVNPGGVVTHRLEHCAAHDPPGKPQPRPTWCGRCDPTTRKVLDDNGLPSPRRCPDCHPLARKETDGPLPS